MTRSKKITLLSVLLAVLCSMAVFAADAAPVVSFQPNTTEIVVFLCGCVVLAIMVIRIIQNGFRCDF
ncbi:MAG: hypothetical protein ACI3XY_03770 [Butyricicoccaceae bacterium]